MPRSTKKILWAVLNLVGFVGTVVVNALANALPINNITTGELSDLYPNLFVPAGLTFSIWGLIYLLLAVFVVYQLGAALRARGAGGELLDRIGALFVVASAANIGWIFAWQYRLVGLSLVLMLVLLASLLALYLRLRVGVSSATARERYLVHLPFSVYLGWITVATIANVTALLVNAGWNRFGAGEAFWTVAVIAVAAVITLGVLFSRRDIFYSLVVVWALVGIVIKRTSVDPEPVRSVVIAALAALALISLGIVVQVIRRALGRGGVY
jgi:hypothetical protein